MKLKKILLLLPFLLVGCKENTSISTSISTSIPTSISTSISKSTSEDVQETILLEKHFSKANDDNFENFFGLGWSTANSKFGTNSVILLEDANHKYGSGYVRTPEFGKTNDINISLTIQVTGFNNSTNINKFVDQSFKFGISLLDKDNTVINDTDLIFEHKITQSDCNNKYFSSLNNYTTNPSEAKTLDFTYSSDTPISKISVNYLSKPHYIENSKDNGINLEIFSLIVKK